jgi:hypothetical protein
MVPLLQLVEGWQNGKMMKDDYCYPYYMLVKQAMDIVPQVYSTTPLDRGSRLGHPGARTG